MKTAAMAATVALFASAAPGGVREEVRNEIDRQIKAGYFTGAVVAAGGFEPMAAGYRTTSPERRATTTETRFDCASVTKTVVAMTCARLAAQGRIDVDRPFTDYLTDHVLAGGNCRVTVRDLAMHVGGFDASNAYQAHRDYGEFRKAAMNLRPQWAPGEHYEYACVNMIYIGWIIEKATGLRLDEAAKKYVFEPLGMDDSGWGPLPKDADVAYIPVSAVHLSMKRWKGYNGDPGQISDPGANFVSPHPIGNAGMFSTAGDLLKFARDLTERRCFERAAYDLVLACGYEKGPVRRSFGFDMSVDKIAGGASTASVAHTGWSGQSLLADPETGFYGVVLTARSSMESGKCRRARDRILSLMMPRRSADAVHSLIPAPKSFVRRAGCWTCRGDAASAASEVKRVFDAALPAEGYRLSVAADGVTLAASTDEGAFRGLTTFRQLREFMGGANTWPCCEIADRPAYAWRAYMLDEGRHFFGVETVKRVLDLMAEYKLNVFHWHLTEDQGWRIEIKKYPKLVEYAAKRPYSPPYGENEGSNGTPYGPFYYTQAQIRDVVAYAEARHIKVVPEIEVPGHSRAVLAAYPEFACDPESVKERVPRCSWGISDEVMCAGNPAAMKFYEDVLDEICGLFPSDVVHLGGDECPRTFWRKCPKCQARIKRENLAGETDLQSSVTRHFCEYLAKKGRRTMVWDEALVGGYGETADAELFPKTAIAQSWRGAGPAMAAATNGFDTVVTPWQDTYFSVPQGCADDSFAYSAWIGPVTLPLRRVFTWEPSRGMPPAAKVHALGSEACHWTERMLDATQLEYKSWPRTLGFAEAMWTAAPVRDYADFRRRAALHRSRLIRPPWRVHCAPLE
ncbi:MAG: family 20 glycosylhydrolase [Kiritimatiellae bacterium]|nr:family 20 glycosylhydrolase [Kiritimatiellia bacterium]